MAELAARDGMPPPADLPQGECIVTRLDDGTLRVDRADPRILISGELLYEIATESSPWASILPPPGNQWDGAGTLEGALLKICGVNQTVIYRVGQYFPRIRAYIGEWPD